jgi:putative PIN family toxin of toxin-antitoxin system
MKPNKWIVLDTNVIVSGLLSAYGPPGRIVDSLLMGFVGIAYDDRIWGEYNDVLARPKFKFDPYRVAALLHFLKINGRFTPAAPLTQLNMALVPDINDLPFAEVAVAAKVNALVTGNVKHFGFLEAYAVPVLSPTEFVQDWL